MIHNSDFEKLKDKALGNGGKEACNARNLAAGSIHVLNPSICKECCVHFYAFNIIEGIEAFGELADSRGKLLQAIQRLGFNICPFVSMKRDAALEKIETEIQRLKVLAEDMQVPIDGIVLRYESLAYSRGCGRTGHHYKDGIAFKFEDDNYETVDLLRK